MTDILWEKQTQPRQVHGRVQTRRCRAGPHVWQADRPDRQGPGIYDSTLGNWVRQDRIDRGKQEGLTSVERTRLAELEAENAKLRMQRDLLKRTVALLGEEDGGAVRRYRRVDDLQGCRVPGSSCL
jgi:hypothetical protein